LSHTSKFFYYFFEIKKQRINTLKQKLNSNKSSTGTKKTFKYPYSRNPQIPKQLNGGKQSRKKYVSTKKKT
jgi:hypothetical protein